jgi:pyrroline-5-carboxylate reductase
MNISFIGGGVMAEALIRGILDRKISKPSELLICDPSGERRTYLEAEFSVKTSPTNDGASNFAKLIILAIKPQAVEKIFSSLNGTMKNESIVMSIVAGLKSESITQGLAHDLIVRVMPNTPAQIGLGISVWTALPGISDVYKKLIKKVLQTLGDEYFVRDETLLDMSTALSASGPAYVYLFIESFIDAGVYLGMPRDMARHLVLQTVLGSTELIKKTGKHPAELKDMVTSPAGTTIGALVSMENDSLRAAVINGVRKAYERTLELGEK